MNTRQTVIMHRCINAGSADKDLMNALVVKGAGMYARSIWANSFVPSASQIPKDSKR
jgi:hypothetical protein